MDATVDVIDVIVVADVSPLASPRNGKPEVAPTTHDSSTTGNETLSTSGDLQSSIDYDELYEAESDADADVDMKSHGSVLTHLLSQVSTFFRNPS